MVKEHRDDSNCLKLKTCQTFLHSSPPSRTAHSSVEISEHYLFEVSVKPYLAAFISSCLLGCPYLLPQRPPACEPMQMLAFRFILAAGS